MATGAIGAHRRGKRLWSHWLGGFGLVVLVSAVLTACGSSGPAQASATSPQTTCQSVAAVLSDGPDPGADPVGYALAQVVPLRSIKKSSDAALQEAIDTLATAYQGYYQSKGHDSTATRAVNRAADRINDLCPGAGAEV
jgi:hypothetical protein